MSSVNTSRILLPRAVWPLVCIVALVLGLIPPARSMPHIDPKSDSLASVLKTSSGSRRIAVLLELSIRLSENTPDASIRYAHEALALADSLQLDGERARALNMVGLYHYGQGRFELALEHFLHVLAIGEKTGNTTALSLAFTNIGHIYNDIGLFDSALTFYKKDLAICERISDKAGIATARNNIGLIQDEKGDKAGAIASFRASLELAQQAGDRELEGIVLNNIGDAFLHENKFNEALEYFLRARAICNSINDHFTVATTFHNIGLVMRKLGRYDEALYNLQESMRINTHLGADHALLSDTRELAATYAAKGNYRTAFTYLLQHDTLTNRVFSVETGKKIADLQIRRQLELRDHENRDLRRTKELREAQARQDEILRNAMILGMVLLAALGLVVFNRFQLKKRSEQAYRVRTEELESVDRLVKTINHQVSVDGLFRALLELGRTLFPQADKAAVLVYDDESDGFRVLSSFGMDDSAGGPVLLAAPILTGDWVRNVATVEKIGEGISIFHFKDDAIESDSCTGVCPRSRLVLDIEIEHRLAGILLFDNYSTRDSFPASEIDRWIRFREHAVAALIKATLLEESQRARHAAEEASSIKTRLLSIASHDLKNPLSVIIGIAEIIEGDTEDQAKTRDLAGMIRESGNRMLSLLYDLLDMSELEMGRIILNFRAVDVIPLVEAAVHEYRPLAEKKRQQLKLTVGSAGPLHVMADEKRLREAVTNLVDNAIKFSPLDASIYVTVVKLDKVQIAVRDEGPGLTERDKMLVFGQFQRLSARPTAGEPSTGVGLSIVKQVIELHGGSVTVESEEGKGSTFIIEL
ncbi:MAG: tetratricopeptide repeat protein [Ignavibacteriae bacterium]|nr:tetratricopeptide repeat protein [Ignavibacteriota bacterium]